MPSTRSPSRPRRLTVRVAQVSAVVLVVCVALVVTGAVRSPFWYTVGGDLDLARSARSGVRVLFVGNSFTYRNDLPGMLHRLAAADPGAPPVFAVGFTAPGATLARASRQRKLRELLRDVRWHDVVLQEQSTLPSLPSEQRVREMDPYVRDLHAAVSADGEQTVLLMTWAYRDGDRHRVPNDTFAAMQARIARTYADLALTLPARLAPVGLAWEEALRRDPGLELWARDGRHPSRAGTYLAACVLYAHLVGRSPAGSAFTAGLDPREAAILREAAVAATPAPATAR